MKRTNQPTDPATQELSDEQTETLEEQAFKKLRSALERQPATFTDDYFAHLGNDLDEVTADDEEEEDESDDDQPSADGGTRDPSAGGGTLDVDQGGIAAVCDAAIGTNGMGPCIAVGKTGLFRNRRYSALTHWDGIGPSSDAATLFQLLDGAITAKMQEVAGATGQLTGVTYLVVGGRPDSATNQQEIRDALGSLGITADGILVTPQNTPFAATAESSATISETGEFSWDVVPEGT